VGALGCYLEEAGVATTQISLVREHTQAIRPPRALWVPFMFGRPFGAPGDAALQRRVLLAALRLLEAPAGPVLEDYPGDAPAAAAEEAQGIACPVSFAGTEAEGPGAVLLREVEEIAPWYDLARERRGRTTVGLTGVPPAEAARVVAAWLDGGVGGRLRNLGAAETLKLVCEDLRAYYFEAAAARPGGAHWQEIQRWFWRDTAAGQAFHALQQVCLASGDEAVRQFGARALVPNAIQREP
jgi:hypothetical protein